MSDKEQTSKKSEESVADRFTRIYLKKEWGEGSGPGSDEYACRPYLRFLRMLVDNKSSVVDFGCGDLRLYGKRPSNYFPKYWGVDAVTQEVLKHPLLDYRAMFTQVTNWRKDTQLDFIIGQATLLLIKDVFQHWPTKEIQDFMCYIRDFDHFRSGKLAVVITNDYNPEVPTNNTDIEFGQHRPLDLEALDVLQDNEAFKFTWLCKADSREKETIHLRRRKYASW